MIETVFVGKRDDLDDLIDWDETCDFDNAEMATGRAIADGEKMAYFEEFRTLAKDYGKRIKIEIAPRARFGSNGVTDTAKCFTVGDYLYFKRDKTELYYRVNWKFVDMNEEGVVTTNGVV